MTGQSIGYPDDHSGRIYYLYRHVREDNNEVFYVGAGTKKQKWNQSHRFIYDRAYTKYYRNKYWYQTISETAYRIEIILECESLEELHVKEKEFIALYGRRDLNMGTLVNMSNGGKGALGRTVSEETRQKNAKASMGPYSPERLEKFRAFRKTHSRPGCKGKRNPKSIPIIQTDLDGNVIKEFESIHMAAIETGINLTSITRCLKGTSKKIELKIADGNTKMILKQLKQNDNGK